MLLELKAENYAVIDRGCGFVWAGAESAAGCDRAGNSISIDALEERLPTTVADHVLRAVASSPLREIGIIEELNRGCLPQSKTEELARSESGVHVRSSPPWRRKFGQR